MLKYKILLVDDDSLILEALCDALEGQGYYVMTADNGSDALKIIEKSDFDIVITDLVMDEVDGAKVLKESKLKNPETRVMILTGYGDLTSAIDVLRLEADDYILKPCSDDELFFRVSKCIEKIVYRKKVKIYENILPVCCMCKKIRDDRESKPGLGEWMKVEEYLTRKAKISVTSSYCPECANILKEEIARAR
jgi:YesN/AraC family two-component response regulator